MKKGLLIALCLFLWFAVYKVCTDRSVLNVPTGQTTTSQLPDLQVLKYEGYMEGSTLYVEGKVRNNTERNYRYVEIRFDVYNEANEKCGTAWTNESGLAPHETWAFKAVSTAERPTNYKLASVSGH
jgi:hypothetical protein